MTNPLDLPMDARDDDLVVGRDELGMPIRVTRSGRRYLVSYPTRAVPQARGILETIIDDQGRSIHTRREERPTRTGQVLSGLLNALVDGVTAPGRALRGETVTLGDVWNTAIDNGLIAAPMPAPSGALRAGFMGHQGAAGEIEDVLRAAYPDVSVSISRGPSGGVTLNRIIVPSQMRGRGMGSQVMEHLTHLADERGVTIGLSPSGDFGGNPRRLRDFYERFGFQRNTGRGRDFEISESMYRRPSGQVLR